MDIGKAFTFIFEDPDWLKKVAIGSGLLLLGIIFSVVLIGLIPLIIITGYTVLLVKNVMDGAERPLPEWEDWGDLFMRGLKLFLIVLIWAIPLIFVSLFSSLPLALVEEGSNVRAIGELEEFVATLLPLALVEEGSNVRVIMVVISICCGCLTAILSIAYALLEPVLTFRFARTNDFASGFEFGKIFRLLGDNIVNIIIAVIVAGVAGVILLILGTFVGTIALVIGLLVTIPATAFLSTLVEAHLIGQEGREAEAKAVVSD